MQYDYSNLGETPGRLRYNPPLQNLKFGFPLSVCHPLGLCNTIMKNQLPVLQHPRPLKNIFLKKQIGLKLGALQNIPSSQFQCSSLLTCFKDWGRRRIILDLSYPQGFSLNDFVDRVKFHGQILLLSSCQWTISL